MTKRISIFCGSSPGARPSFAAVAISLARCRPPGVEILLKLFDNAVAKKFPKREHREMALSAASPESLVESVLEYDLPLVDKWIDRKQT